MPISKRMLKNLKVESILQTWDFVGEGMLVEEDQHSIQRH